MFVFDAGGALAAEYSTQVETANPQESYLTADHLGSPRVITDKTGNVISRRDFMPFGEELGAGVGTRSTTLKYAASGVDSVRKRYTGYEKDTETDLDFAEARMYQNKHGRFTAVDPLMASASPSDPQTFNRYSHTGNNPINRTDPMGLDWCKVGKDIFNRSQCKSGEENITGSTSEIAQCSSACADNGVQVGDTVKWLANGVLELVPPKNAAQVARDTGTEVQATQDVIITSGSADIATTTITQRQVEPLPDCVPAYVCTGIRDPDKDAANAQAFADFSGEVPGGMVDGAKSLIDIPNMPIYIFMPGTSLNDLGIANSWFNYNSDQPMNGLQGIGNTFGRGVTYVAVGWLTGRIGGATVRLAPVIPEEVVLHGNDLNSLRATWGYRLFLNDGTFLKNGITSQPIAEARYSKTFMNDKFMEKVLFPNRRAARMWEIEKNTTSPGPLNINR